MKNEKFSLEWAGKSLSIEVGKLAQQANSSVTVQYGDTVVLATVVMGEEPREGIKYFPLMVEYEERLYAAGKIKGSRFIKREGRPSDEAILTARLVDRAIRPLFNEATRNDVQVVLTVLSIDQENDPDVPALVAAATALTISDIPWNGPIVGIRVGQIEGEWVLNPTYEARAKSIIDLLVAGTTDKVVMLEGGANEAPDEVAIEAVTFGQKHLKPVLELITKVAEKVGREKGAVVTEEEMIIEERETSKEEYEVIMSKTRDWLKEKLPMILFDSTKQTKAARKEAVEKLKAELEESLKEDQLGKDKRKEALKIVEEEVEKYVTEAILKKEQRVDGRKLTDIRALSAEAGLLPRTHGSALFNRGETQVLSIVTLGSPSDEQILDGMEENGKKRYMHHYNFPPFCVGEVSPMRGPGRREIGHGALAEKALLPVLPDKEEFPYTVRVVSEVLGSNGSSSMGSTCGSSLALMDAGVPIKRTVAGVAMGLASDDKGNFKVLTDLQDLEDGQGGMDFKIAGTSQGITVIQMDTKTQGLSAEIIKQTFVQGRQALNKIIKAMEAVIAKPRAELSVHAPRIITIKINPDKIRDVIGPGGKMIHEIIDKTGVNIDIEQDGTVLITSADHEGSERAVQWVKDLTREVEAGEILTGKVTRILDFGAFVEVLPNQEGLIHISELAPHRVEKVEDVVKIGDTVTVKVINIDDQHRINLSLKQADPNYKFEPRRDSRDHRGDDRRGGRDYDRGGDRRKKPFFKRGSRGASRGDHRSRH